MTCISEMPAHSGFIKAVAVDSSHGILITAGDRTIQLWDLVSLNNIQSFKVGIDETRALCIDEENQLLFSAGKGNAKRGGLMAWDLRKQVLMEEKEKNQDIFCIYRKDYLYYGSRDRYVHALDLQRLEKGPAL